MNGGVFVAYSNASSFENRQDLFDKFDIVPKNTVIYVRNIIPFEIWSIIKLRSSSVGYASNRLVADKQTRTHFHVCDKTMRRRATWMVSTNLFTSSSHF